MIDVRIIYSNHNKQYKVVRAYDGFALHTSGVFKNKENAAFNAQQLLMNHDNWRLDRIIYT